MRAPFAADRPDIVHRAVCAALGSVFPTVTPHCLLEAERTNQTLAWLRQVGMYVMVSRLGISQARTAWHFKRDRTTVIYAVRVVASAIGRSSGTRAFADLIEEETRNQLDRFAALELDGQELAHG